MEEWEEKLLHLPSGEERTWRAAAMGPGEAGPPGHAAFHLP